MDAKIGGRVLAGIAVGILVGLGLLVTMPVGVQPGDVLEGRVGLFTPPVTAGIEVSIPKERGATEVTVKLSGEDTPLPLRDLSSVEIEVPQSAIAGKRLEAVEQALAAKLRDETGLQLDFQLDRVKERAEVSTRPWPTELAFILGQFFMRLLQMLVVPLIAVSVLIGIASLGDMRKLGTIGKHTTGFYLLTVSIAAVIGLFWVNLLQPGVPLREQFPQAEPAAIADQTPTQLLLRIVPTNPVKAFAEMDVVGMLFFIIVLGLAMLAVGRRHSAPVFNFAECLHDLLMVLIGWVMKLAPVGVGALIAHTIGTQDWGFLGPLMQGLGKYALCIVLGLATHFVVYMILLRWLGKYSIRRFLTQFGPVAAVAFGTSSSNATLPVTLQATAKMGVSKRIADFVIPVGATLNMDGTALFEVVAVMFFAQAFGNDLGLGGQLIVMVTGALAAMGAAGIPSAGLVTMVIVLSAVGLPASKVGLLWAIDRPLDMMRTVLNVMGDSLCCRVVQTWNPDIRPEDDEKATEYVDYSPEDSHDAKPNPPNDRQSP